MTHSMGRNEYDATTGDRHATNTGDYAQVLTPREDDDTRAVVAVSMADQDTTKKENNTFDENEGSQDKKPDAEAPPPLPFAQLYRYATRMDKVLVTVAVVCAAINGALFPCMALLFGDALAAFQQADGGVDRDAVNKVALNYFFIAVALFVTDYVAHVLFIATAERQMKKLRAEALTHMLFMNVGWFDTSDVMQLTNRLTGDTVKIKDGMAQKLGEAVKFTSQFATGFIIAFSQKWDVTLVMSCVMPMMGLSLAFLIYLVNSHMAHMQRLEAAGSAVVEETLASMRTVASLNSEQRVIDAYNAKVQEMERGNLALVKFGSLVLGFFMGSVWLMYAAGLWYGGSRVVNNTATPSDIFQAFFGVLIGTMAVAQISTSMTAVTEARGAASVLYKVLDTPSTIDASKETGMVPDSCAGAIEAIDVEFTYPSRPDAPILNGYNVKIEAGQTVAFVGASGGGKSTLINLLERFYDPQAGQILLDGRDIKTLNLSWLRSQIGMVSQEPVLFARTIYENIAAGGEGITRERAIEAAKKANAHSFIMSLPQQYDTLVGEKGASLSGGQKQRVAIARALVRNPKILVLDEATSALDAESERIVQDALNDLMRETKMTTLVIAHRLSTIRHADKIVVLAGGRVVEAGAHEELLAISDGVYHGLYTIQDTMTKEETDAMRMDLSRAKEEAPIMMKQRIQSTRSSMSFQDITMDDAKQEAEAKTPFGVLDAIAFSRPERPTFIVGLIAAAICGIGFPGSAVLFSEIVATMNANYAKYMSSGNHAYLDDLSDDIMLYGVIYLCGAVVIFICAGTQSYCFRFMAEKVKTRLRDLHFTSLCRQDIAFFDEKKNSAGALASDLTTHATKVGAIFGDCLGRVMQASFTFIAAVAISFATGSWLLTLIMLAIFPFLLLGEIVRSNHVKKSGGLSDELADVGAHASEALGNIRTVVSLGLEKTTIAAFDKLLDVPVKDGQAQARINGFTLAFSSFIVFATYSLVFWYGGKLVEDEDITFLELMRTLMAIMMSAQGMGAAASFMGEAANATKAGAAIVTVRDRPLSIDSFDQGGERPATVEGKIEFKNITFRYPTRPGVTVLKNYNLTIEAGQTVAFCGPSGGGKSTCVSMIERFYDPVQGQVMLDGHDLKTLNVQWLRSQIGLVGQEPTLFIGTIAENISFGLATKPSQEEIESAAKMANAHDFITRFPDGYSTQVGAKGEQLSGGQKQRIAIARAILKNPNILLLDEATSALDTESEKIVQEALDKVVALKRRTTVIIAHRLSTIRKADKICVVSGGHIAEQGTHSELLAMNGIYKKLVETAST